METDDLKEIQDLIYRYSRAIDTKNWPLLRSVFADPGEIVFAFDADRFPDEKELSWTADEFVAHLVKSQDGMNAFHAMSNITVDFDSKSSAQAVTYGRSLVAPVAQADGGFESIGFYSDRLIRHEGSWSIEQRRYERRFRLSA